MKLPFQEHHLLNALNQYQNQRLPLDQFLNFYFRSHKSLGSKDRAFIAETVYGMIRWLSLIDYHLTEPFTWEKRFNIYKKEFWRQSQAPDHVRVSFPKELYDLIKKSYPYSSIEICLESNLPAPTTVRVNPAKISRNELLIKWKDFEVFPTVYSPFGITFKKKISLFSLSEFKDGFFEMQDEGSQLLALKINTNPGDQILDYCAGSGGKSLAFAHLTESKGQIYLHDIRSSALLQAKKRLKRAGIQNAQCITASDPKLEKLKKKMDWVLVDAPCSGTGTLRRNPDMKWRFDSAMLKRIISEQRVIFEKALSYLKPGGKIVYATCSLLNEENEDQMAHFLRTYSLEVDGDIFKSVPSQGGMDGFFAVTFKRPSA